MRIGIYGGSFDPVHNGHLLLAEACREQCALEQVWFVPADVPPHKRDRQLSTNQRRVEMLKLATSGHPAFRVDTRELERGGVSYTVDTLEELQREDPTRELFFLMGGDSLADLKTWKDPERICELAVPAVVGRFGADPVDLNVLADLVSQERLAVIKQFQVVMPIIDLRSSDIRRRISERKSIRYQVSAAVEAYIETHGLYAS